MEVERFLERLRLRARHQHEAGAFRAQERVHLGRALPEAIVHALEGEEELGELLQELQAHEAVGELQERRPRARRHLEREAPGHEVGTQEEAQHAHVEESQ